MRKSEIVFLWLCAVSGITFWFLIGFPFAHSHESYYWMGEYFSKSFYDFVFEPIGHYATFRPLGQLLSAALFELSARTLFLIQLFNFSITISAVWLILKNSPEKKILSLVFLIIGGTLFAAFAYLFHLHGLYYSPVLLFISLLIYYYYQPLTVKNAVMTFSAGLIASLFHPYAVFIYIFYSGAQLLENKRTVNKDLVICVSAGTILSIILFFILVPAGTIFISGTNILGLMKIYRSLQLNPLISLVILGLSIVTVLGIPAGRKVRIILILSLILASSFLYILKLPLLLIVFAAGILKLAHLRKWSFLALLIVTFMFSVFTDIESGHLKFYVLFVIAFISTLNLKVPVFESLFKPVYGTFLILIVFLLVVVIRNDIRIPGISKYAASLLATSESSHNLNKAVEWYIRSDYSEYDIEISGDAGKNIPASNENLQMYLESVRGKLSSNTGKIIIIQFTKIAPDFQPVYSIKGKYAENLYVYFGNP